MMRYKIKAEMLPIRRKTLSNHQSINKINCMISMYMYVLHELKDNNGLFIRETIDSITQTLHREETVIC